MNLQNEVEWLSDEIISVLSPYFKEDSNYYKIGKELEDMLFNYIPDMIHEFLLDVKKELKVENFI